MAKVSKYVKGKAPEGRQERSGEVWLNAYGDSVDEKGKAVVYLIRQERVDILHLEREIKNEEDRLNDKKAKLKAAKGE